MFWCCRHILRILIRKNQFRKEFPKDQIEILGVPRQGGSGYSFQVLASCGLSTPIPHAVAPKSRKLILAGIEQCIRLQHSVQQSKQDPHPLFANHKHTAKQQSKSNRQ
jgi:hypothetical protein